MSKRRQTDDDRLMSDLRASLERLDQATPDDVFGDRTTSSRSREADEELAAFDRYMADLLSEVDPGDSPRSGRGGKSAKQTARRAPKKESKPAVAALTADAEVLDLSATELSATELSETELAEELLPTEPLSPEPLALEEHLGEQIAVPEEIYREDPPPRESFALPAEEPEPAEDLSVTAYGAEGSTAPVEEPMPGGFGPEDIIPVEGLAPVREVAEVPEDTILLQKGDVLLDADDDSVPVEPAPPVAVAEPQPAPQNMPDKSEPAESVPAPSAEGASGAMAPVSSPLDAARMEAARPKSSPLDAMTAGRRGNVAPVGASVPQPLRGAMRERAMSDEDIELLLDLGYENSLDEKLAATRVEAVKRRRKEEARGTPGGMTYGYAGEEYTGHGQDKAIRDTYRKNGRVITARLVFTLLLTGMIGIADLFPLIRHRLPEVFSVLPTSGLWGLAGLGLLIVAALLSLPSLKRGLAGLVRFAPCPQTGPAVLLLFTVCYDIWGLFDATPGVLLNLPTAAALLLLCVGDSLRVRTQRTAFSVVSAHSRKLALEEQSPKKKKVVRDGHIVKIIHDDADRTLYRVRQTEQPGGYFARTSRPTERYRALGAVLAGAMFFALLLGVMALLILEDLRSAAMAVLITLQVGLPAVALVSYAYPMYLATTQLSRRGCTIVGDGAVDEYSARSILMFDDTEMFRAKSSTEITIKGGGDAKKYIRYAKRLFHTLGGTLQSVTTSDLSEETYEERVEILRIAEEGLEARMDGRVRVLAGTSAFMIKHGVRVPGESAEVAVRRHVESCILYLAFDGKLRLGYEIDYRISGRFEQMVAQLAKDGTAVAIEAVDPDIHNELLARSRRPELPPIRVIKPHRHRKPVDAGPLDSGLVATRSARDIAKALLYCHRISDNDRRCAHVLRIAMLSGVVFSGVLTLTGLLSPGVSLIVALIQPVWCIPALLITRKNLINEQDQDRENDK